MFADLSAEDAAELARELVPHRFKRGDMIFRLGDRGTHLYLVEAGNVNIHLGTGDDQVSLKNISRGEYFGEMALFDDQPRSANAIASTDVSLQELGREPFFDFLGDHPRAAIAILRTVSQRLRETNVLLSERLSKNVVEEIEKNLTWKDRLADRIADLNGSWRFIIGLGILTTIWAIGNVLMVKGAFDPYPFVFFNLLLGVLVALQGPLIMMSQNRQSLKDRARAETDFKLNLKNEVNIENILRELREMRKLRAEAAALFSTEHPPIEAPPAEPIRKADAK